MGLKVLPYLHSKMGQGELFAHQPPRHCRGIAFSANGFSIAVNHTPGVGRTNTFVGCRGQEMSRAAPERNGARDRRAGMDLEIA